MIVEQGIVMPDADYRLIRAGSGMHKLGRRMVIVDAADYAELWWRDWKLYRGESGNYYAWATIDGKQVLMHRYIMGLVGWQYFDDVVDHIDGFGLNNRRYNLRIVTQAVNQQNCKEWKVERNRTTMLWEVIVTAVDGSKTVLGPYPSYSAAHEERWVKRDYWGMWE